MVYRIVFSFMQLFLSLKKKVKHVKLKCTRHFSIFP